MAKRGGGIKKKKVELVFDPQKRRDFLTGFRKRKQERRQKAKEELEQQVKEERKRIKQELKDNIQNQFKRSLAPIELEGALKEEEYDTENVTVQIVELSTDELAKTNHWIGPNKPIYSVNGVDSDDQEENGEEDEAVEDKEDDVPGFTVTKMKPKAKQVKKESGKQSEKTESKPARLKGFKAKDLEEVKSKRGIGQLLAKKTQNKLKQSKAFRTKEKLDRVKNQKKARIEREKKDKAIKKKGKFKKDTSKTEKRRKFGRK